MAKNPIVIDALYAVVGKDEDDNEGIAAYLDPATNVMMPLVGGLNRVPHLLQMGKALAIASGRELRLVKFSTRGNLDRLTPDELPQ